MVHKDCAYESDRERTLDKIDQLSSAAARLEVVANKLDKAKLPERMMRAESRLGWHEAIAGTLLPLVFGLIGRSLGWW